METAAKKSEGGGSEGQRWEDRERWRRAQVCQQRPRPRPRTRWSSSYCVRMRSLDSEEGRWARNRLMWGSAMEGRATETLDHREDGQVVAGQVKPETSLEAKGQPLTLSYSGTAWEGRALWKRWAFSGGTEGRRKSRRPSVRCADSARGATGWVDRGWAGMPRTGRWM